MKKAPPRTAIQLSEETKRILKIKAAKANLGLSEYLNELIKRRDLTEKQWERDLQDDVLAVKPPIDDILPGLSTATLNFLSKNFWSRKGVTSKFVADELKTRLGDEVVKVGKKTADGGVEVELVKNALNTTHYDIINEKVTERNEALAKLRQRRERLGQ